MRYIITIIALCLISGCGSPPKPRSCEGDFKPVNIEQKGASLGSSISPCKGGAHEQQG